MSPKVTPLPVDRARRWTAADVARLRDLWLSQPPELIAALFKRSEDSVMSKACKLGLGPSPARYKSLRRIADETGYSWERIESAVKKLWPGGGIQAVRVPAHKRLRIGESTGKAWRFRFSPENEARLLEFLRVIPDGAKLFRDRAGNLRTTRGVWGVGSKPPECTLCASDLKPHYAKGRCRPCYHRVVRARGES